MIPFLSKSIGGAHVRLTDLAWTATAEKFSGEPLGTIIGDKGHYYKHNEHDFMINVYHLGV